MENCIDMIPVKLKIVTSTQILSPVSAVTSGNSMVKPLGGFPPPPPPPVPISTEPSIPFKGTIIPLASDTSIGVGVSLTVSGVVTSEPSTSKHSWNKLVPSDTLVPAARSSLNHDTVIFPALESAIAVACGVVRLIFSDHVYDRFADS